MAKTNIGWTDENWNAYTWNCNKVSPGCKHCYAEALAKRYGKTFTGAPEWSPNADKRLAAIKPGSTAFVNTMSDTYHEGASLEMIQRIHTGVVSRPDVLFFLLTKRPERALALANELPWPDNLWMGTSAEDNQRLNERVPRLLEIPARNHFLSAEPLLGPLDNFFWYAFDLDWVIVGGESGLHRRPMDYNWVRTIRDECSYKSVLFFYKQGNSRYPGEDRILDGVTHDERPYLSMASDEPKQGRLL